MKLCTIIGRAIDKSGMSVQTVADEMNVSRQTVYGWINGTKTPRMPKIFKLSKLLAIQILTFEPNNSR